MKLSRCLLTETHIASSLSTASTTHHAAFHSAAPPVRTGAGLVVNQRQVGLLQLCGQAAAVYGEEERTKFQRGNIHMALKQN